MHVQYSGRIKSYELEGLVVTVLVVVPPRPAARRWTVATALAVVLGALVLGATSAFTLVITAVVTNDHTFVLNGYVGFFDRSDPDLFAVLRATMRA